MMACPNMKLEQPYFAMLDKTDAFKIKDDTLILFSQNKISSKFVPYKKSTDSHNAENSLDYQGKYSGTLPAADCPGIKTVLTLYHDSSYTMSMGYIDRDTKYNETGAYTVEGNLLTLTSNGQSQYYKIGENKLTKLDANK